MQTRRPDQALHDHRRAARREGQGDHRQRRRRVRRARLRLRLRRRDRRAGLALLHRARRSADSRSSSPTLADGREDLERRVVEGRRRRHGLGLDGLRPRARPALRRHRQRLAVEPRACAARAAATTCSCPRSSRCGPTPASYVWHYQTTPGETWDYTATQHIMLADLDDRRPAAQGADAGAEERLLLRARPRHRRADLGRAVRARSPGPSGVDLATGRPIENPDARYDEREQAVVAHAGPARRAQLAPDVVQPEDRASSTSRCNDLPFAYADDPNFKPQPLGFNIGIRRRQGQRAAGRSQDEGSAARRPCTATCARGIR